MFIILGLVMLVSFSYCDDIIFFLKFNLCKYLRIYSLKVVNITTCKIVRLIVTIISISIIVVQYYCFYYYWYKLLVLVFTYREIVFIVIIKLCFLKLCKYFRIYSLKL